MYAVIQSGSRQYRVEAGQRLQVEKLDRKLGESFDIENVVFVGGDKPAAGAPFVKGAKVSVVVVQQAKGPKVLIFKKKRRHGYRRLKGHRQLFTELFVAAISANGQTVKADTNPVIVDPVKKAERIAKQKEALSSLPKTEKKAKAKKVAKKKAKAAPKKKKAAAKKTKKAKKKAKKS
jgi:large subunit ribosomal protein L21